jgi:hypothetical protein
MMIPTVGEAISQNLKNCCGRVKRRLHSELAGANTASSTPLFFSDVGCQLAGAP